MLAVTVDHPVAQLGRRLTIEDLAELELLLPLPGTAFRDELDAAVRPLGITLLPAAEIDGLRTIASLAFEGYGPAILPATAIPAMLHDRVRAFPVEGLPRRRVGVAQRSRGLPSAPSRALLELLELRGLAARGGATRTAPARLSGAQARPGAFGSRHMRQMGGLPDTWTSPMTSNPDRA